MPRPEARRPRGLAFERVERRELMAVLTPAFVAPPSAAEGHESVFSTRTQVAFDASPALPNTALRSVELVGSAWDAAAKVEFTAFQGDREQRASLEVVSAEHGPGIQVTGQALAVDTGGFSSRFHVYAPDNPDDPLQLKVLDGGKVTEQREIHSGDLVEVSAGDGFIIYLQPQAELPYVANLKNYLTIRPDSGRVKDSERLSSYSSDWYAAYFPGRGEDVRAFFYYDAPGLSKAEQDAVMRQVMAGSGSHPLILSSFEVAKEAGDASSRSVPLEPFNYLELARLAGHVPNQAANPLQTAIDRPVDGVLLQPGKMNPGALNLIVTPTTNDRGLYTVIDVLGRDGTVRIEPVYALLTTGEKQPVPNELLRRISDSQVIVAANIARPLVQLSGTAREYELTVDYVFSVDEVLADSEQSVELDLQSIRHPNHPEGVFPGVTEVQGTDDVVLGNGNVLVGVRAKGGGLSPITLEVRVGDTGAREDALVRRMEVVVPPGQYRSVSMDVSGIHPQKFVSVWAIGSDGTVLDSDLRRSRKPQPADLESYASDPEKVKRLERIESRNTNAAQERAAAEAPVDAAFENALQQAFDHEEHARQQEVEESSGRINESLIKRLQEQGLSDAEIRARMDDREGIMGAPSVEHQAGVDAGVRSSPPIGPDNTQLPPTVHANPPRDVQVSSAIPNVALGPFLPASVNPNTTIGPAPNKLDDLQMAFDVLGLVPFIGEPIDLLNAGISLVRGKEEDAALSAISAIPGAGYFGTTGKVARFAAKHGPEAMDAARVPGAASVYSARELLRRSTDPGSFHNFPESFNRTLFDQGARTVTPNHWRTARPGLSNDSVMYRLRGSVNGREGVFELGTRPSVSGNTEVIIHRTFVPD